MPQLDLKPRVLKFIKTLPPKHKRQIKDHILSLGNNPFPADSKSLVGFEHYRRTDSGEYRVIYRYEPEADLVMVVLVGKRNDDEVYRVARRLLK